MNKASGKLAAGVRKVKAKTQEQAPAAGEKGVVLAAAPKRAPATPPAAASAQHPARVWPD